MAPKMEDLSGKWMEAKPLTGMADCMFSTISCCTWKICPSSFGGKFVIGEDGLLRAVDNYCAYHRARICPPLRRNL